jgi:hypothetical protein
MRREGYSDQERKRVDLDKWLQHLASGMSIIPTEINSYVGPNPNENLFIRFLMLFFPRPNQ